MIKLSNLRLIFNGEYEDLYDDWQRQNAEIDQLIAKRNRQSKEIAELEKSLSKSRIEYVQDVRKLNEKLEKKETELEEKEKQRKTAACKLGGYQKEINKLRAQVEFLKNNKRAPNLEELKDYQLRRKTLNKK